jgi:hypothetical protein
MVKKILFVCVLCFCSFKTIANTYSKDSILSKVSTPPKLNSKTKSFKELEALLTSDKFNYTPKTSEFDAAYISRHFSVDSVTNGELSAAKEVMGALDASQNYIDILSPNDLVTLPVGIKKEVGNNTYTLGITKARITPEYTEVTAFLRVIIPQLDAQGNQKQLFFGANNIKLSHKGGIYGEANLVLLGDVPIPIKGGNAMIVLRGGFDMKTGDTKDLTYVTVDCGGFKTLSVNSDIYFPRSMLEPVDKAYNVIPEGEKDNQGRLVDKVSASFQIVVSDWNDILVDISLPPFQLTKFNSTDGSGKAGLIFELNTAVFDFSDIRNSPNVVFPKDYQQYLISGNEQLWRGVYVNSLKVTLPKQFKKRKNSERVTFEASNLLIDGMGVSGTFSVDNILPLNEGDASKWQFSVNHIEAGFVANTLTHAEFNGRVVLPLTSEITEADLQNKDTTVVNKKALKYNALIDPVNEDYTLTVNTQSDLSFNVFKAKATLTSNSYIELKVSEGNFRPKAVLHGNLAIKGSNSTADPEKATVDFKGVTFEKLQLQTQTPYVEVERMGYNGKVQFANFPVTLSKIEIIANDKEASLRAKVDVNLMESGFSGGTSISIVGNIEDHKGLQRWKYSHIDVNQIEVKADLGSIQIEGMVDIKDDDPVYGDGFYGELGATFNGIKVNASAWFGKKDYRYWYVDAYADLSNTPVKVYIGPAIVNGFGGGAYYHMSKAAGQYSSKIPSGQSYVPNEKSGLGFRALLGFALANEKAFNGKVGFEMAFNKSGGLNRVLFFGEGHIVKALDFKFGDKFKEKLTKMEDKINGFGENNATMQQLKESNLVDYSKVAFPQDGLSFDVGIDAHFSMEMDFQNKVFHSEMEVFVNTPGGFFKGVGPKGRAGWAVFHAARDKWYLHVGTPHDRIGLKLGLGNFNVSATSYLMIGDDIPGSPPPPAAVAEFLGEKLETLDSMRDLNALGGGRGFAFGTNLSVDTGDMTFLIFYARFRAGLGFDIMIKDYGDTACHGSGQIGIDGWYANGQAYAYLGGELGVNIKLLFIRKKIPIIRAGAAVLLQAKLPNPAWFRGYLGGYFDLLGGLVKGSFRFKIELGEECDIIGGSPLGGIKVISDITPSENAKNIDVFAVPQAVFNMRVNKPFELEDDAGVKTYRILLDEYTVTSNGTPILGAVEWNQNNDVANFVSHDILPPHTPIKIVVAVSFQEKQGQSWITLTDNGDVAQEIIERNFTTGEAPDYIPLNNIVYCYPVIDQNYFYENESSKGYVKLKRGQAYLFASDRGMTHKVYFEDDSSTNTNPINLAYNQGEKLVNFNFPSLEKQKSYKIRMVSIAANGNNTAGNLNQNYRTHATQQEGNSIEIRNGKAQNITKENAEIELLVYDFKTSEYNTFAEKIESKKVKQHYLEPISTFVDALQTDMEASEKFDLVELQGCNYTAYKPLVEVEAVLDDSYYVDNIYPLIYEGYPLQPQFTVKRDVNLLGIPPKKAIHILTWYKTQLETNSSYSSLYERIPYRYYLPYYYRKDFLNIQYKIADAYLTNTSQYQQEIQRYDHIISGAFPVIKKGDYKMKMQYMLPGEIKGTSTIFKFNNPF